MRMIKVRIETVVILLISTYCCVVQDQDRIDGFKFNGDKYEDEDEEDDDVEGSDLANAEETTRRSSQSSTSPGKSSTCQDKPSTSSDKPSTSPVKSSSPENSSTSPSKAAIHLELRPRSLHQNQQLLHLYHGKLRGRMQGTK